MELALEPLVLVLLLAAAFTAGFVDAVAGGGGMILLPALLTAGLPPHLALGTNKCAATFGTATSAFTYVRKGLFKLRLWRAAALATLIGACGGSLLTFLFSADTLAAFLPLLIATTAVYLLAHRGLGRRAENPVRYEPPKASSAALGGVLGGYDGFFGPGTGTFWTTLLMTLYPLGIVEASGVARAMNFISNAVALATFAALGSVDAGIGLMLGTVSVAGAWIGAHSAIRFGAGFIRPAMILVALALTLRLIWSEWLG